MVAVKMGMPVPPMGGMPGMMPPAPMPQPPMGAGPMVPPPMPVPPMQPQMPMGQGSAPVAPNMRSNAPRRKRFGDALEGMMAAGRPQVGADQMANMNMFTGQMMGSTMMTPMSRTAMAPQPPVRRMAQGGLAMGPAPDGFGVYLDGNRLVDPSDMHQKMLRAGYSRDEIMDSASALRNSAAHIADDLGAYGSGARSGFGHSHYANGGEVLPRRTTIAGQPHYLAYINPEEGALLKGLGGAEAPGPGGVPSYFIHHNFSGGSSSSSSSSGGRDRDADAFAGSNYAPTSNAGTSSASQTFRNVHTGETFDSAYDLHESYGFGDDNDSPAPSPAPAPAPAPAPIPSYTDTSSIAGISAASGIDYSQPTGGTVNTGSKDADLGVGMNTNTVTAADLAGTGSSNLTTTPLPGGGSVTTVTDAYTSPIEAVSIGGGGSSSKPVFYDQFGNAYDTAEEAAAADAAYAKAEADRIAEEERIRKEEELRLAREAQAREDAIAAAQAAYQEQLADQLAQYGKAQETLDRNLSYATNQNVVVEQARAEVARELADRGISATPEELDYLTTQRMLALEEPAPAFVAEQLSGMEGVSKPVSESAAVLGGPEVDIFNIGLGAPDMPLPGEGSGDEQLESFVSTGSGVPTIDQATPIPPLTDDDMGLPDRPVLFDDPRNFDPSTEAGSPFIQTKAPIAARDEDMDPFGTGTQLSLQDVKDRVSRAEGTSDAGGYDRLLGGQEDEFGIKPTEMTVQEVLDFQKKRGEGSYAEYSQGVNQRRGVTRDDGTGVISTPVGKYQIVGATLQDLVNKGIVDPDAKFDEATQERLGSYLINERRGLGALQAGDITREEFLKNLGQEFEGIARFGFEPDAGFNLGGQDSVNEAVSTIAGSPVDASNYLERTGLASTAAAGMDPGAVNAAEARYLQRLMESVDDPNLLDQIVGGLGKALTYGMFDINEFNREKAQEALDAYKETGDFIYDTEQSNLFYEPIDLKDQEALEKLERLSAGEGQMPAVVGIADAEGNRTGFSTAIMNTPDGPLTRDEYAELVASRQPDDDEPVVVDPCPEGYVLDPETQICVPVEEGVGGEGGEEEGDNIGLNRPRVPIESLDDIMKRIVQVPSAPAEGKTNLPVPMKQGGMVGLNRVADNFLAAMGR